MSRRPTSAACTCPTTCLEHTHTHTRRRARRNGRRKQKTKQFLVRIADQHSFAEYKSLVRLFDINILIQPHFCCDQTILALCAQSVVSAKHQPTYEVNREASGEQPNYNRALLRREQISSTQRPITPSHQSTSNARKRSCLPECRGA